MPDRMNVAIESFLALHGPFDKPPLFRRGDKIGDWRVTAFLGRGATSEVYRAENAATGQVGAVKVLVREDAKALVRFRREVALLADAACAAFPHFYGAGRHDDLAFLAMELLEPATLPTLDADVARFMLGVCEGVQALHVRGYVHRDIKPRNVMRRPSTGEPVLIDLGLAKENSESALAISDTLSVVDGQAVGVGTMGYSAPEQFAGGRIGAAADVHALGMLANECFNHRPPRVWAEIIRRSTSSAPEQRYATVAAFVRAIRHRHLGRNFAIAACIVASAVVVASVGIAPGTANQPDVKSSPAKDNATSFFTTDELIEALAQTTGVGDVQTIEPQDAQAVENGNDLFALGTTVYERNAEKTTINLGGRDISLAGETVLREGQNVVVIGPGRLTASISGERGASVKLQHGATLINLTTKPYPESAMKYIVGGKSYLNFKNLKSPASGDIKNVWVDDMSGDGHLPVILFGGPATRGEAESGIGFSL